jgi:hypothetical protein
MGIETLAIASTVGTVAGGLFQGQSQAAMYNYQAQVSKNNAIIAQQNADYATAQGETEAQTEGMKTAQQIGTIRSQGGASGLDVNSGSKGAVVSSATELGELDAMTIRNNAAWKAYGFKTQEMNFQAQSDVEKSAASKSMFASLMGTATGVSDKWMQFSRMGISPFSGSA